MASRGLNPPDVAAPVGSYVHGMLVPPGVRLLFVSGQIPAAADRSVPQGFDAQCRAAWQNVIRVLADAGAGPHDLVKVTTFLVDRANADRNGEIRREFLGSHAPALTVVVAQTFDPVWLLEIEAVAVIGPASVEYGEEP